MGDDTVVRNTAAEFRRQVGVYRGELTIEDAAQCDDVLSKLEAAADARDSTGNTDADYDFRTLIAEADYLLRVELGQLPPRFRPEGLRLAALDAHKRLHRHGLS